MRRLCSKAHLEEAQRAAHVGHWEWNILKNKLTWSPELYRIYGLVEVKLSKSVRQLSALLELGKAVAAMLENSGEVQVVAGAATGQEAVELTEAHEPDVVVMDLSMPRLNGVEAERTADLITPREREVLQLIAEGNTNRAISETLHISIKTVEKHRANIMAKLEVNDLASLIREAIKQKLILLDE